MRGVYAAPAILRKRARCTAPRVPDLMPEARPPTRCGANWCAGRPLRSGH